MSNNRDFKMSTINLHINYIIFKIYNRLSEKGRYANFMCILKDCVKYVCINTNREKKKIHKVN